MDYTDAEILTSFSLLPYVQKYRPCDISCFFCVNHKGGTVPEK